MYVYNNNTHCTTSACRPITESEIVIPFMCYLCFEIDFNPYFGFISKLE